MWDALSIESLFLIGMLRYVQLSLGKGLVN